MAMTLVQQCKAWFEAAEDDRIIAAVVQSQYSKGRPADSRAAAAMPPGPDRRQRIDELFWLGAATCRKAIRSSDRDLLRSGVHLLLPLYGDYCDDLNYFVTLALSFDYLGEHEQALLCLYEALAQFPAVAHIDDMIADSARALNVAQLQTLHQTRFLSWHSRCRRIWEQLLGRRERIEHLTDKSDSSNSVLKEIEAELNTLLSTLSRLINCQVSMPGEYIKVTLCCSGHDSMILPLQHFMALMPSVFARKWRFVPGQTAEGPAVITSDGLAFGSSECWCALAHATALPQWLGTVPAVSALDAGRSAPAATGNASPAGATAAAADETIARANLTNNLGQKKTSFPPVAAPGDAAPADQEQAALADKDAPLSAMQSTASDSAVRESAAAQPDKQSPSTDAASAARDDVRDDAPDDAASADPLAGLDPDLFPDLFDDDDSMSDESADEPTAAAQDGDSGAAALAAACSSGMVDDQGLRRVHVDLYHPMLYTWFKASRSQHPQVLDQMLRRLVATATGELSTLCLIDSISLVQSKPQLGFRLDMLSQPLQALTLPRIENIAQAMDARWFYYAGWQRRQDLVGTAAPVAAVCRAGQTLPSSGSLSATCGPQRAVSGSQQPQEKSDDRAGSALTGSCSALSGRSSSYPASALSVTGAESLTSYQGMAGAGPDMGLTAAALNEAADSERRDFHEGLNSPYEGINAVQDLERSVFHEDLNGTYEGSTSVLDPERSVFHAELNSHYEGTTEALDPERSDFDADLNGHYEGTTAVLDCERGDFHAERSESSVAAPALATDATAAADAADQTLATDGLDTDSAEGEDTQSHAYSVIDNRDLWQPEPEVEEESLPVECPQLRTDIIEGVSCLRDMMLELNSESVDAQAIDLMSAGAVPLTVALTKEDFARLVRGAAAAQSKAGGKGKGKGKGKGAKKVPVTVPSADAADSTVVTEVSLEQAAAVACCLVDWLKEQGLQWSMSVTGWARGEHCCYLDVLSMDMDLCLESLCQWISVTATGAADTLSASKQSPADSDQAPVAQEGSILLFVQPMVKGSMVSVIEFSDREGTRAG